MNDVILELEMYNWQDHQVTLKGIKALKSMYLQVSYNKVRQQNRFLVFRDTLTFMVFVTCTLCSYFF